MLVMMRNQDEEGFKISKIFASFASLPRALKIVWESSPFLTIALGFLNVVRGLTPAISVTISQLLIDGVLVGIRQHTLAPIWLPVILQLSASLLTSLLTTSSTVVQQVLQEHVTEHIQLMILKKANTLDLAFFENPEFYDKLRRASDESGYRPLNMVSQLFDLGRTVVTLVSLLAILFQLAWWLIFVAMLAPIPSFIANSRYGRLGFKLSHRQSPERRHMAYFNRVMTVDEFNKEIKLFKLGDFFIKRYKELAEKLRKENTRIAVPRAIANFLWSSLSVAANSVIYLFVALRAVLDPAHVTLGALTKYTQASSQAGQSFQGILDGVTSTYENNLYVDTLFEFLDYQPAIVSPPEPMPIEAEPEVKGMEIEFRNVTFTYPGKPRPALKDISFKVRAGETIALVGRNGAGKTTLVKLLTRLYDPDAGEILVGGRNVKEYDLEELRDQVGVIFQDYVRYYMNARENIGMGLVDKIENMELVQQAARKSGADGVVEKLPDGYETMLGSWFRLGRNDGVNLSGGEWQKIALARAFMRDARILVLDEPTSALDAQAEYDVFTRFRLLTEGKTAVFISHRFSTVRLADRILVIENGELIENGSHHQLMELEGRYAELFNLQAEAYR